MREEVAMMNKRIVICMLILLLLVLLVLTYYGQLLAKLNQNTDIEEQIIKDIKQVVVLQESTDVDVNIKKDSNETIINPDDDIEERKESNGTIITKKNNTQDKLPIGYDCIVSIPIISLEKIVYTGSLRESHLEQYDLITAADDMKYSNGGNYIICGHYSQLYGHSLNRLKELNKGDFVYINSNGTLHKYTVYSKEFETMTETSTYCVQTEQRELTIISCAKYVGVDKYIVIKCKLV